MAIQIQRGLAGPAQDADAEQEKQAAIALYQQRIDAAVHVYGNELLSREEWGAES